MKTFYIAAFFLINTISPITGFCAIKGSASNVQENFPSEIVSPACNYHAYPDNNIPEPTQAPNGYEAFHIEHYGRHGSRWLLNEKDYTAPLAILRAADAENKLTSRGKDVLKELEAIASDSQKRWGELTPLGAKQHQGIARRMTSNYPTVFKKGTKIDAKSTVVIRCILSMLNEVQEIKSAIPDIDIKTDASHADMLYMNNSDTDSAKIAETRNALPLLDEFNNRHRCPNDFLKVLFNDPEYAHSNINVNELGNMLYEIATNMESHPERNSQLMDIFSKEDIMNKWIQTNARWFINSGSSSITNGMVPLSQRYLLENILTSTDSTLTSPTISVNLRFGHESVVLPLVVLMELDHYGTQIDNLDDLATKWHCDEVFPMAANLQLIFYRPTDKKQIKPENVLVKILLNEKEASLPIETDTAPYYQYKKLAEYYRTKLSQNKF